MNCGDRAWNAPAPCLEMFHAPMAAFARNHSSTMGLREEESRGAARQRQHEREQRRQGDVAAAQQHNLSLVTI